jgi:hypothetical protein
LIVPMIIAIRTSRQWGPIKLAESDTSVKTVQKLSHLEQCDASDLDQKQSPIARDGTVFCIKGYMLGDFCAAGEKGTEGQLSDYQAALGYLRAMPVAKWRRPNPTCNWGITRAVNWADAQ